MPSSNVPWEGGCGPADPGISQLGGPYSGPPPIGTGYAPNRGGTGKVGTINAGASTPVPLAGFPAQVRWFIGADGQLHALTNQTMQDFVAPPGANPQQPPVYSPTK